MNLRNVLAFGTVLASLAVPSIASAQRFGGGRMGGWRGGPVGRSMPVYNRYAAPVYSTYAQPVYYPPVAAAPVYYGNTGYGGYAAPVYRGGWGGGFEHGRGGGWGRGGRR